MLNTTISRKSRIFLAVLIAHCGFLQIGQVMAQTFTTLYNFTNVISPNALILSETALFGTTSGGGSVFAVNTDGTRFRTLHAFTQRDGAFPKSQLILSGTSLYGT